MKKNKKKDNKLTFKKYLCIFIGILSLIVTFLVYFINIFPLEYFIIFVK